MNKSSAVVHLTVKQHQGFTLIELLITISILAIIATMGMVAFTNSLKQMEAKNTASNLMSFLVSAKQDALIYQNPITVCLTNNSLSCVKTGGSQLISFIDKNNNNRFDASLDKLNHQIKLNLSWGTLTTDVALNRAYIIFKPENSRPIGYMGNMQYCPSDGSVNDRFKVSFNITGMIKYKPYSLEAFDCP